jgi:hypothetical protein
MTKAMHVHDNSDADLGCYGIDKRDEGNMPDLGR